MSQRIADASAKLARSFYPLPRMTDNDLFGLSRTMTGLSGEVVQRSNVSKSFNSYSARQHAEQPLAAVHEGGYGPSRRILRWNLMSAFGVLQTLYEASTKQIGSE